VTLEAGQWLVVDRAEAGARAGLPDGRLSHPPALPCQRPAAGWTLIHGVPLTVVSEVLGHSSIAITGDVHGHVGT
jgi:integrase